MYSQKTVVMADDDADDCFMATEAFREAGIEAAFACVSDGIELLDHLWEGSHSEGTLPGLILLDLNMPLKNGADTLVEIKSHPAFRHIPVVILTTSGKGEVNSNLVSMADAFITKPSSFDDWIEIMKSLAERWLDDATMSKL